MSKATQYAAAKRHTNKRFSVTTIKKIQELAYQLKVDVIEFFCF